MFARGKFKRILLCIFRTGDDEFPDAEHKDRASPTKKSSSTSRLSDRQASIRQGSKMNARKEFNGESGRWKRKNPAQSSASPDFAGKDCPPMAILREFDLPREPSTLPTYDLEEIQSLLLCELSFNI